MKLHTWFLSLLLFLLTATSAQAATKYVNKSGVDGARNCTNNTTDACLTIDYALGKMSGGDTLIIGNGIYTEAIRQSGWPSGSGTTYTTLMAQNNKQVTINTAAGSPPSNFAIYNADSHHIAFDGIIVASTTAWANGSHHITFRNGEIKDGRNQNENCLLVNGTGNQLINNTIHNCGDPPINQAQNVYWGGDNGLIEGNDFYDNSGGYLLQIQYTTAFNNTIRNNRFHNDNGPSLRSVVISCYDPDGTGGAHDNFFYNNLLYNNSGSALRACTTNTTIYSNTFYGNDTGIEIYGGNNTIKNNLLYNNGTDFTTSSGSITASNNMCATTCTFGSSNQSGNPQFISVNPASLDFLKLGAVSAAINNGANLGPSFSPDAASVARPSSPNPWEIGAYEFTAGVAPSVVITVPTSAAIYSTSSATIGVSGSSTQSGGSVTWTCDRCTPSSGMATGTVSWSIPSLTLKAGINILTVTGTSALGDSGVDTLTITYAPTFPGNSLVLAMAFDEGSGTSITDSSGNSNTGTSHGVPTWSTGRYGNALQFNGATQYVDITHNNNSLDLTQSFTISLWVQPTAVNTTYRSLVAKTAVGGFSPPYRFFSSVQGVAGECGTGGIAGFSNANGQSGPEDLVCSATPLQVSAWTHLALTYDGANLKLYKQGSLVATQPHTGYMEPSTGILQIATSQYDEYFHGLIDELRIYNFALPLTGGANTVFGAGCNATDAANVKTASIIGDANCPVIPLAPPITFKVGASTTLKLSASSTTKIGSVPQ